MIKSNREESKLVKACLSSDIVAQKRLYNLFATKMYVVCLRYCKKKHEAEDLLQESMYRVFKDLKMYNGDGSLEGWIRKVVVNTNLQFIRNRKIVFDPESKIEERHENHFDHLSIYQKLENEELLSYVKLLPEGCQLVFNLYVIESFSHKEISDKLSITIGTSKSQLFKARKLLKEKLPRELVENTYGRK